MPDRSLQQLATSRPESCHVRGTDVAEPHVPPLQLGHCAVPQQGLAGSTDGSTRLAAVRCAVSSATRTRSCNSSSNNDVSSGTAPGSRTGEAPGWAEQLQSTEPRLHDVEVEPTPSMQSTA